MHFSTINTAQAASKQLNKLINKEDTRSRSTVASSHKEIQSKLILYVIEYGHLRNPPAKKKHQATLWLVVIGFHHFQRLLQFSLQGLTQTNTKLPFPPELASREAVKCNRLNEYQLETLKLLFQKYTTISAFRNCRTSKFQRHKNLSSHQIRANHSL